MTIAPEVFETVTSVPTASFAICWLSSPACRLKIGFFAYGYFFVVKHLLTILSFGKKLGEVEQATIHMPDYPPTRYAALHHRITYIMVNILANNPLNYISNAYYNARTNY